MNRKINIAVVLIGIMAVILLGGCRTIMVLEPEPEKPLDYPNRPIKFIVPFGPGGGADIQARTMEKYAYKYLGQPFVVENKPGSGGFIGYNALASSEPDGYTLAVSSVDLLLQTIFGGSVFHYATALDPLATFAHSPQLIVVSAEQPWQTLEDFINYTKEHPNEIKSGHSGLGSVSHIVNAAFSYYTGLQVDHVPFKSAAETIGAMLGGHIQYTCGNPSVFREQIKAGKVRALAVTAEKRLDDPMFKDVPTLQEKGYDVVFDNWFGIISPKPLPPRIKEKLEIETKNMATDPEYIERIRQLGLEPLYLNNYDSLDLWSADMKRLRKMVKETGILEEVVQFRKAQKQK